MRSFSSVRPYFFLWILIIVKSAIAAPEAKSISENLYDIPLKTIAGEATTLKPYQGKVLLIVNTASKCGYTDQYKGLQSLYDQFQKRGLVVLGFPSNDFLWQEPGNNAEIKKFCEMKFKVSFPMFEKGAVNGSDRQPLYQYLLSDSRRVGGKRIKWNFEKFLISKDGKTLERFAPSKEPTHPDIIQAIEKALQ